MESLHIQSTINTVGDKVVGGLPNAPEPDSLTSRPFSGKIWEGETEVMIISGKHS